MEGGKLPSQPSDSDSGALSQSNPTSNQRYEQRQTSSQEEFVNTQNKWEELQHMQPEEQNSSKVELALQGIDAENQPQQNGCPVEHDQPSLQQKQPHEDQKNQQPKQKSLQFSDENQVQISEKIIVQHPEQDRFQHFESPNQYSKLQQFNTQQAPAANQANNQIMQNQPIHILQHARLIQALLPQIDKDRAMQLREIFAKLRGNEVSYEDFVRGFWKIVGGDIMRQVTDEIHIQAKDARNLQAHSQQDQLQSDAASQLHTMLPRNVQQFTDAQPFSQIHSASSAHQQKGHGFSPHQSQVPPLTDQMQTDSMKNSGQKSRGREHKSDAQGGRVSQISSANVNTTNQEKEIPMASVQAVQHPQTSFSFHGGAVSKYHGPAYSGVRRRPTSQDSQLWKPPVRSLPHLTSHSPLQQNPIARQSSLNKEQKDRTLSSRVYVQQVDQASDQQHIPQMSAPVSLSSFGTVHIDQRNPAPRTLMDETAEQQSTRMGFPPSTSIMAAHQISGSVATQLDPMLQGRRHQKSCGGRLKSAGPHVAKVRSVLQSQTMANTVSLSLSAPRDARIRELEEALRFKDQEMNLRLKNAAALAMTQLQFKDQEMKLQINSAVAEVMGRARVETRCLQLRIDDLQTQLRREKDCVADMFRRLMRACSSVPSSRGDPLALPKRVQAYSIPISDTVNSEVQTLNQATLPPVPLPWLVQQPDPQPETNLEVAEDIAETNQRSAKRSRVD